uniref:Uncharacterized protein n=1 Tax=Anguilla anguilla TaxID=7936 RepID=A0A0E9UCW5_ANGAN
MLTTTHANSCDLIVKCNPQCSGERRNNTFHLVVEQC